MGQIVTSFTTYTGKQSEFRELITQKFSQYPALAALGFNVVNDIQSVKKMYKTPYLDKITKKRVGCSTTSTETGNGVAVTSFDLAVTDMQIQLPLCADVFASTIAETALKKGFDINNLEGTEIESMLAEMILEAAGRDAFRTLFLGDTTLSNTDYTAFDGLFKKLKAGYLAADGTVQADGSITSTDINLTNIVTTFNNFIDAQPSELKYMDDAAKVFYVTHPVYEAWKRYLQSTNFSGVGAQRDALINGIPTLSFNGIPVVSLGLLSKYIDTDFATGSPATAATANRIILTTPENHYIATDLLEDTAKLDFWYERKEDTNYTRLRYKLGFNYAFGNMNVIGGW